MPTSLVLAHWFSRSAMNQGELDGAIPNLDRGWGGGRGGGGGEGGGGTGEGAQISPK